MRILGLDIGIASIGWAIVNQENNVRRIVATGVYAFDAPENRKDSNKKIHGDMKRRRRQVHRGAKRMRKIRKLLYKFKVLPQFDCHALNRAYKAAVASHKGPSPTVYELRKEGLSRALTSDEWAVVLAHMARHRGYLSNSKRGKNEPDGGDKDDRKKVLKALAENDKAYGRAVQRGDVETIGEWLSGFERQRNREGDYRFTIKREWVQDEARVLFARQRNYKNSAASAELEDEFFKAAFAQGPVITKNSVGDCTFEIGEKRAPRHCYSFELFRLLQRLNNLRILPLNGPPRRLTEDQIGQVVSGFGKQQGITYRTLRRALNLGPDDRFDGVPDDEAETDDVVARKGKAVPGTAALRKVIIGKHGEATWRGLLAHRDTLDGIARAIAHYNGLDEIQVELEKLDLKDAVRESLLIEADGGALGFFRGTGHLSIKALRKLEPHLLAGFDYYDAQIKAEYDPSKDRFSRRPGITGYGVRAVRQWLRTDQIETLIPNQVVSRAVRHSFRQVLAILGQHGPIDAIHVEMSRNVGKSTEARRKIENEQKRNEARRVGVRKSFVDCFGRAPSDSEFKRWFLWKEQLGKCAFTGKDMRCTWVLDGDQRVQVEHILPRSRFRIDAMTNKVLCLAHANQNKGQQTPYEWLSKGGGPVSWEEFKDRARVMFKGNKGKLRNLLVVDVTNLERAFRNRDLNDTRWIAKFLRAGLERLGTRAAPMRVQPVNAGLVGMLRYAWGLDGWKRDPSDPKKRRLDDRHHALDAAITATIDQRLVNRLTMAYQKAEQREEYFPAKRFDPPWYTFPRELIDCVYGEGAWDTGPKNYVSDQEKGIFVVRAESRRARGPVHEETYFAVRRKDDQSEATFQCIPIKKFEEKHLPYVKDKDRQQRLYSKLEDWVSRGRPLDDPPTLPYKNGTGVLVERPIRRVRVEATRHPPAIRIETGDDRRPDTLVPSVDREQIVRLDVFAAPAAADTGFQLVPIYRHNLKDEHPPNLALASGGERPLALGSEFLLSIFKRSYLRISLHDGSVFEGYYRFFDRESGRIELTPHFTQERAFGRRITPSRIRSIEKVVVERTGLLLRNGVPIIVKRETRTWHGAACT